MRSSDTILPSSDAVPAPGGIAAPGPRPRVSQPGRIRRLGPLVALAVPVTLFSLAGAVWLGWSCEGLACARPSTVAYGFWLLAAPTTLLTGIPLYFSGAAVAAALGSSALVWLLLGRWAAWRATRDVDATWRTYWAELAVMAVAVWVGLGVGFAVLAFWLGV